MRMRETTPPDGLERSRPREVRLTSGGKALVATGVVLWLGAIAAFTGMQLERNRQAEQREVFAERSVAGVAEVTRLWRGGGEGKPRMVAYRLDVQGKSYTGQARLGSQEWSRLRVGESIAVRYLPSDPGALRLGAGRGSDGMPVFVPYLVGGALALVAVLLQFVLRSQRQLLSEGRAALARVTKHHRGEHGKSYEYEFTTLAGRKVTGKSGPGKSPAVGSSVWVLYDPDNPRGNAVYPFSLFTPVYRRSL